MDKLARFAIPTTFLHGATNACFLPAQHRGHVGAGGHWRGHEAQVDQALAWSSDATVWTLSAGTCARIASTRALRSVMS